MLVQDAKSKQGNDPNVNKVAPFALGDSPNAAG